MSSAFEDSPASSRRGSATLESAHPIDSHGVTLAQHYSYQNAGVYVPSLYADNTTQPGQFLGSGDGSLQGLQESPSAAWSDDQVGGDRVTDPIAEVPMPGAFQQAPDNYHRYDSNEVSTHQATAYSPALDESSSMPAPTLDSGSRGTPAADSYAVDTFQTAALVAAEARQFASALAASFSGMEVAKVGEPSAPAQPVTPQQLGVQQEAECSQLAPTHLSEPVRQETPGGFGHDSTPGSSIANRHNQREAFAAAGRIREEEAVAAAAHSYHLSPSTTAYPVEDFGEEYEEPAEAHHSHLSHDAALKAYSQRPPTPPFDPSLPSYMRPTVNSVTRNSPQPENGLGARLRDSPRASPRASGTQSDQRYEPIKKSMPAEALGLESVLDTFNMPRPAASEQELRRYLPAQKKEALVIPGLDEVLIISKSKLELEKEACAAAAANNDSPWSDRPVTPVRGEDASAVAAANRIRAAREASASSHARLFAPINKKPTVTDADDGKGLGAVLKKHVCALDRTKIAAKAAGDGSPTARVHSSGSKLLAQQRAEWGNMGLLELQKPHKSRLTREQEAWAEAHGEKYVSPMRKIEHRGRKVHTPGADPGAPSFMRDTCSSTQKHIDVGEAPAPRTP